MSQRNFGSALRTPPATLGPATRRGWEVLNPQRIRRGRTIEWRVSARTRAAFAELLTELVALEEEPQTGEVLARMEGLREDIRALPGYPRRYDAERDVIVPTVTSVQR